MFGPCWDPEVMVFTIPIIARWQQGTFLIEEIKSSLFIYNYILSLHTHALAFTGENKPPSSVAFAPSLTAHPDFKYNCLNFRDKHL